MKVLIICTEKLPVPPVKGGAIQTYIAGAVPFLKKKHDITILGRNDPTLPDQETIDGIQYVRVPGGLLEVYRDGVVDYVKGNTFDLIHIFNRPRLVAAVREVAPKARIVLSMHNDMFKPEKIDQEEGAEAVEQVDKIITISNYIGDTIKGFFPKAEPKLKTIYSGVDLDRFVPAYSDKGRRLRDAIRKEHNLESKKVILFTGRLSPNKGADILVKAMPILAKKHPDVALVLVGSKWFSVNDVTDYIAYVRALAERLPIPVVTTGFVDPKEIQNWFAAADVFVCPSQWQEPLARVHYEAMAAGLPIITTNRGGNAEVIDLGKNGLIVENPEDPAEFAEHLTKLLSSSSIRKEMGQYGRKKAEENFNWNRVVSDIMDVWNEVEDKVKNNVPIGADSAVVEGAIDESTVKPAEDIVGSIEAIEDKDSKLNKALKEIFKVMKENIDTNEALIGSDLTAQVKAIIEDMEAKMLSNHELLQSDLSTIAQDVIAEAEDQGETIGDELREVVEDTAQEVIEKIEEISEAIETDDVETPVDDMTEVEDALPKKKLYVVESNPPSPPWLSININVKKRKTG